MLHPVLIGYFLLQPLLKMFGYRARGMAHTNLNDTEARLLFWAMPYALDGLLFSFLLTPEHSWYFHTGVAGLCLAAAFVSATIPHSDWQSPSGYNYFVMGLITTGMLTVMLSPLFFYDLSLVRFIPYGMLGWLACIWGYNGPYKNKYLTLFGVTWCRPVSIGGSEWEEFFIGAWPFGCAIALVGLSLLGVL